MGRAAGRHDGGPRGVRGGAPLHTHATGQQCAPAHGCIIIISHGVHCTHAVQLPSFVVQRPRLRGRGCEQREVACGVCAGAQSARAAQRGGGARHVPPLELGCAAKQVVQPGQSPIRVRARAHAVVPLRRYLQRAGGRTSPVDRSQLRVWHGLPARWPAAG